MPQALALARRFVDDIVSSPLNICLVGLIVYFSYKLIRRDGSSTAAKKNPKENGPKQNAIAEKRKKTFQKRKKKKRDCLKKWRTPPMRCNSNCSDRFRLN